MSELYLLRHAKSSWAEPDLADHDRPLSTRGREAAPRMGRFIAQKMTPPIGVLCSTALRARETLELVIEGLGATPEAILTRAIYEADGDALLELIRGVDAGEGPVMVIGHNPALEDLATRLTGPRTNEAARIRMAEKYPTCALAAFEFDGPLSELAYGAASLTRFQTPREL